MKVKFIICLAALSLALCACGPRERTYADAEKDFLSSLNSADTLGVLSLGDSFMRNLREGELDEAMSFVYVVHDGVLYKPSDESLADLKSRFTTMPVKDYILSQYAFSTPGVNDLVYRYSVSGTVNSGPALRVCLNPVAVEGAWYLTIKDANMPSVLEPSSMISPLAPAPDTLKLNRRPAAN